MVFVTISSTNVEVVEFCGFTFSSTPAVSLRASRVGTTMQMEKPNGMEMFRKRASSFVAGLYVAGALITGTPGVIEPAFAAKKEGENETSLCLSANAPVSFHARGRP